MEKQKFKTDRQVAALKPLQGKRTDFYHGSEKGFFIRVSPAGTKSWMVSYAVKGRPRRKIAIGKYPSMSLADARQEAREIRMNAYDGIDRLSDRKKRFQAPTVACICRFYFKTAALAPKTKKEGKQAVENDIIPFLGHLKAKDIVRADVKLLHKKVVDRSAPVSANRLLELLRRIFNTAYEEELLELNPFPSIKKILAPEAPRDRILRDAELHNIWLGLETETPNVRDILRLLLLLGQRSKEICSMAVNDIDPDSKTWTVPAAVTIIRKPNVLPLPDMAWDIIEPRLKNDIWIFPSTIRNGKTNATGHHINLKHGRIRLQKATGTTGWTTHDLRRTARTLMAKQGVEPHIAEQVLGHTVKGVAAVYDQYSYIDEKRKALELLELAVRNITGIKSPPALVIELKRA